MRFVALLMLVLLVACAEKESAVDDAPKPVPEPVAAGEPQDRGEASGPCRLERPFEAGTSTVRHGEREDVVGSVQAQGLGKLATGDALEQRAGEGRVESGPTR